MTIKEILLNEAVKKIVFSLTIFLIVALGFYWRFGHAEKVAFLETNNIVSYYYDIAARFNADLVWPQEDIWHFAPGRAVENAPPFLAYTTVCLYRLVIIFAPDIVFNDFVFFFPVLVFLVWAIVGFYLVKRIFGRFRFSLIFLLLLSLAPNSINLTKFGHYTEEALGAFWLFLAFSFFMLWQKKRKKAFLVGSLFFAVLLVLTWQQFHIIFAVYGLLVALLLFGGKIKEAGGVLAAVLVSLGAAQIFSIYFLHSAYWPSQMIYESYLGLAGYNSDFLRIAMTRRDWGNLTFIKAINYFGIWGSLAWLVGFARLLPDFKKSGEGVYLLIANLMAATLMFFFVKSVFVFFPFFLITASYGGGKLIEIIFSLKHDFKRIF